MLSKLDEMYDGEATKNLLRVHVQNWTQHPYILGGYSLGIGQGYSDSDAFAPLDNRVYFAGAATPIEGQTVAGAAFLISRAAEIL